MALTERQRRRSEELCILPVDTGFLREPERPRLQYTQQDLGRGKGHNNHHDVKCDLQGE